MSPRDVKTIMKLRVPVIARIGSRRMSLGEVLNLNPGSLVELPQAADRPLDLMVNNCQIGCGDPVKVGEKFGIRVAGIGNAADRIRALAGDSTDERPPAEAAPAEPDAETEPE